jgi:formate hydrogenlyase subunit 3/multisubunit Na+/H+ antiporter MnhD subunit
LACSPGPEGGYAFTAIRAHGASDLRSALVLGLVLLGAGSKAGLAPLHVWLPLAHPAAPSHVSALMSGVMTKVAVYGFVRIVFDLLGAPAWWWGLPVLAIGGGTAVLGVLYALMQNDLKRVLAYSTIENIGLIFVALGLSLAFKANGFQAAAALALTAALFHIFNHALFKSVLFFGAGAVLTSTGERRMDRFGGLIHRMPRTSFLFLIACAAASALPPLNGFASEWLVFQAILLSPQLPQWGLKLLVPAVGALLALSAALAAACFVRVFGIVFLGRPRSKAAQDAIEVDRWSLGAMGAFAALCVLAGILP